MIDKGINIFLVIGLIASIALSGFAIFNGYQYWNNPKNCDYCLHQHNVSCRNIIMGKTITTFCN